MKVFEKIFEEHNHTPSPNCFPNFGYSEKKAMDTIIEIAQEHHELKVYKHLITSEWIEDKTRPIKYYLVEGAFNWFSEDSIEKYNYTKSLDGNKKEYCSIYYPAKVIYKVSVYMQ